MVTKVVEEQTQVVTDVVEMLPWEIRDQVQDFIEFLLAHQARESKTGLTLDWRGSLRDKRDRFTSTDLQHQALAWWEG